MSKAIFSIGSGRPIYSAWVPSMRKRKMDLPAEIVNRRERNARYFHIGWDDRLEACGLLIKIHDRRLPMNTAWLIDCDSAAQFLNCTVQSLCKNIEIMRYFRPMERILHYVLRDCALILCIYIHYTHKKTLRSIITDATLYLQTIIYLTRQKMSSRMSNQCTQKSNRTLKTKKKRRNKSPNCHYSKMTCTLQ